MAGVLDGVNQRTQLVGRNRLELLLFRLTGRQRFGINVFKVREVIQCPPLTRLPKAHRVVRGVANLRGKTVPVIDLGMAIGQPPLGDLTKAFVIVAEYNRSVQAFLVSGVDRIINMNWEAILPPPKGTERGSYLTAVTDIDSELVEIIDVEKVLDEVVRRTTDISKEYLSSVPTPEQTRHVLVIDDSSVARNQIKRTLQQLGLECTLAIDGRKGLDLLRAWATEGPIGERVGVIISDIEMPEMDGYTFTTEVRKDPALQHLHIILHTSMSGIFNSTMVEKVGANRFIAKFSPDDLAEAVLAAIEAA